jgi:hypothetical protein
LEQQQACRTPGIGTGSAKFDSAMRYEDEDDLKKPQPVHVAKKGTNAIEAVEGSPWRLRKDGDRDRRRHVV